MTEANLRTRALVLALAASFAASLTVVACGGEDETPDAAEEPAPVDAAIDAPPPPPPGPPKRLFAKRYVVRVFARADRDSERLGYLRAGSTHMARTHDPIGFERCAGGWYELEVGGFVCSGRDVTAFEGRRLPARPPAQPDFEAELPYRYARARRDNLAIYRHLERLQRYDLPVLLPISRKTVIGEVLGLPEPVERDAGTIACLVRGLVARADLFRVHNVKAVADSVRVIASIRGGLLSPSGGGLCR